MKNVFILGSKGNMGRRYHVILNMLGVAVTGTDVDGTLAGIERADGIIIATPTDLHLQHLDAMIRFHLPILCEKPFTKDITKLHSFYDRHGAKVDYIRMVNQYQYMISSNAYGDTEYNYFKTGGDGLVFDCLNIIGLAKGNCVLKNDSPIWKCKINGQTLSQGLVDKSYVDMIEDWVKHPSSNFQYAKTAHEKASAWPKFS